MHGTHGQLHPGGVGVVNVVVGMIGVVGAGSPSPLQSGHHGSQGLK